MNSNGTPQRYPRAVGNQPQTPLLGARFFDLAKMFHKPAPLAPVPESKKYWNAGVNMAYGRARAYSPAWGRMPTGDERARWTKAPVADVRRLPFNVHRGSALTMFGRRVPAPGVESFNRAKALMDYGDPDAAKAELGDLFNDIMGVVVPGWDSRPEWMRGYKVRVDPGKIVQNVQKIAPNAGADALKAANRAGFNLFVNTPAGEVEVTPTNAQALYGAYPFLSRTQGIIGSVPTWIWLAGGAGLVGLFLMRR